jgi:hypothetical protein
LRRLLLLLLLLPLLLPLPLLLLESSCSSTPRALAPAAGILMPMSCGQCSSTN